MKSPDAIAIDAAYERYKHECDVKYADNGPNGGFRTYDKANKSSGGVDDLPYDTDYPQIVSCNLFGNQYDLFRHLAMAGFGAPYGLFAPLDAIHSRLATQILQSWIDTACFAVDVGLVDSPDDAEHCGYVWHLELIRDGHSLSGPKSSHKITDDLAGFTDDGQPVLRDYQPSTSMVPKGPSNGNSLTVTLCNGCTQSSFLHDLRPANDRAF